MSVIFSDIYMCKMEDNIVKPLQPIFYNITIYFDDVYVKRKRNETDILLMR